MDFALIRSFFSTAKKQGWNIFDALTRDLRELGYIPTPLLILQNNWAVTQNLFAPFSGN